MVDWGRVDISYLFKEVLIAIPLIDLVPDEVKRRHPRHLLPHQIVPHTSDQVYIEYQQKAEIEDFECHLELLSDIQILDDGRESSDAEDFEHAKETK